MKKLKNLYLYILILIPLLIITYLTLSAPLLTAVDSGNHLSFSVEYFYSVAEIWQSTDSNLLEKLWNTRRALSASLPQQARFVPNLTYFVTFFFYAFFGRSINAAIYTNFFFLGFIGTFLYLISRKLIDTEGALLSIFIFLVTPGIMEYMRQYGADLPLAAATTAAFFFLMRTEYFTNTKFSAISGLIFGIGINFKVQFVLFLGIPLLMSVIKGILNNGIKSKHLWKNVFLFSVSLIGTIAFIGYETVWGFFVGRMKLVEISNYNFADMALWAVRNALRDGFGNAILFLAMILILFLAVNKSKLKQAYKPLIYSFYIIPLFWVLPVYGRSGIRHMLPFLPIFAVVASAIIIMQRKIIKYSLIIVLLAFFMININNDAYKFERIKEFQTDVCEVADTIKSFSSEENEKINIVYYSFIKDTLDDQPFLIRYLFKLKGNDYELLSLVVNATSSYEILKKRQVDFILIRAPDKQDLSELFSKQVFISSFQKTNRDAFIPIAMMKHEGISAEDLLDAVIGFYQEGTLVLTLDSVNGKIYLISS